MDAIGNVLRGAALRVAAFLRPHQRIRLDRDAFDAAPEPLPDRTRPAWEKVAAVCRAHSRELFYQAVAQESAALRGDAHALAYAAWACEGLAVISAAAAYCLIEDLQAMRHQRADAGRR